MLVYKSLANNTREIAQKQKPFNTISKKCLKAKKRLQPTKKCSKQLLKKWTDTLIPSTEDVVKRQFNKKIYTKSKKKWQPKREKDYYCKLKDLPRQYS